jgi:tellurite resistance protein TehA-like permease
MAVQANSPDVTWERALRVWWALVWRTMIFGMVAGAILGAIAGVGTVITGRGNPHTIGFALGWLASIPVSIYAVRQVLRKRFRTFSIRLVERSEG